MIIRWLGFTAYIITLESLSWELEQTQREVAAEWIKNNEEFELINRCSIGLLVKTSAVTKRFNYDCFSNPNKKGLLKASKEKRIEGYRECFCKPKYVGIVLKYERDVPTYLDFAKKHNLKLLIYSVVKNSNSVEVKLTNVN